MILIVLSSTITLYDSYYSSGECLNVFHTKKYADYYLASYRSYKNFVKEDFC